MTESPSDSLLCDAEQDRMQRLNALHRLPITDPINAAIAKQLEEMERDLDRGGMFAELLDALQSAVNDLRLQGLNITANQYNDVLKRAKELQ